MMGFSAVMFFLLGTTTLKPLLLRCDHTAVSHCLLWPSLTLLGGALIVGMVRLTQHLSLLCEKYSPAVGPEVGGPRPHLGRHRFQPWGMRRGTGSGRALRPRPRRSAGPAGAH
ncbi:Calcium-activated potassium channel subunit beta-3 [Tupaia chinensis]|uniref:Calcium-activated potassium channel subunit beta n=1 Tax=Tupaia chinensis TaxID=246437 RepID=M0QSW4_TUPCH|nr:Calcium-activated potassium channel subunit beta-3 [Tupaia chinensis]